MPYPPRQIPDAPVPMSMIPQAETLSGTDIVVIVQPLNAPGQKVRTMTLSQLASFIAAGELGEIVFVNVNGFRSTVGNNGYSYHHDADPSYNANLDYAIDSNGIHAVLATSGYTKRFEANGNSVLFSKTTSGLVDKVEIFENYIQISHQTRNGANVIKTHTSRIAWDHMRTPEVRVMQDENNYIPISWDSANNEFVIWQRANSGTVAVPKLHVYGTLLVEKDTTIDADMVVTKSMTVAGRTELNGNFTVIKNLYSTDYAELHNRTKVERLNAISGKSYFGVSENSNVNTLVENSGIASAAGDVVIIRNTSSGNITLLIGNYESSQHYSIQLNAFCSMEFIRTGVTTGSGVQWSPLGNCEITIV